jgi:uncharacterized integral membrane protein (TIGR00698 family)
MARFLIPLIALLCLLPDIPLVHYHAIPGWLGLIAGTGMALTLGNPHQAHTKPWTSRLLAWSVMGLGAAMNLKTVAVVGMHGFGYTLVGIASTLTMGFLFTRWIGVGRNTGILISVGTAICGGSAIAAAAPVLRAEDEDTSVALGTVFLLNASALLLFPFIGHALGMQERAFGLWSALAIHDTSSVVGAAASYGPDALTVAATTKLARALWIVPLTLGLGFWVMRKGEHVGSVKAKRPWFILGFLGAAALVTFLPALKPAGLLVSALAKRSLVLTLFLLGLGISRQALRKVGLKPFLLGLLLWFVVGGGTLAALQLGWIR